MSIITTTIMILVVVMIMLMLTAANIVEHYVSGMFLSMWSMLSNNILMSSALCLFPLYG